MSTVQRPPKQTDGAGAGGTTQQEGDRQRTRAVWYGLVAALIAATVILTALNLPFVTHQLALSFTRRPEHYTGLWISPGDVPRAWLAGRPCPVAFQLANHEGDDVIYDYSVTLTQGGRAVQAYTGRAEIHNGEERLLIGTVTPPDPGKLYVLKVSLRGRSERVHVALRTRS